MCCLCGCFSNFSALTASLLCDWFWKLVWPLSHLKLLFVLKSLLPWWMDEREILLPDSLRLLLAVIVMMSHIGFKEPVDLEEHNKSTRQYLLETSGKIFRSLLEVDSRSIMCRERSLAF
ncbi:hypothetical protein BYT27DRAFT_6700514 [Phlegmacium glaucopus]|nr:hypothetical protein BYT27DRAFT_6700514 [Phlegmacium glaucopus]